jgi:hypothetical protein
MSSPIDLVLARLDGFKLRQHGRDRWRACCPAHNGSNPSALSVGVGAENQVLLRCWTGCEVEEIVYSLGLELSDLFPPKPQHHTSGPPARRRLLTAGQALDLLEAEMTLTVVCAADMAAGRPIDESTRQRLLHSAARVSMLKDEAHA